MNPTEAPPRPSGTPPPQGGEDSQYSSPPYGGGVRGGDQNLVS
jgi:hypothetical protein